MSKCERCLLQLILKFVKRETMLPFFAYPLTVLMECDEWLAMNQQHYFEDVIIVFEKIIICKNKALDVCDYWVKAKTVKTNFSLPL